MKKESKKTNTKPKNKCNICNGDKYYVSYDGYYNPCVRCNPNGKVH